jgi:hypothetical protein
MNYILFGKFKDNCYLRTICETECPIFLNSYLHAYVDKTKEEIEADGITYEALPKVLPKYVIDGFKVCLKAKLIEYIEKVFKEYSSKYSCVDRLLFPTLFTQAKEFLSINNSANHDLIEVIADAKEISMKQAAKDMVLKVTAYDEMLYDLFCVETTINSQIDEATKIEEFFVVWNELNTYSMEQIMINVANYKSDFVTSKTTKSKKDKSSCVVI